MADGMVPIGLQIKQKRKALGISRSELARRAEISPSIVTRVEELKSTPQGETLTKFERALKLPKGALSAPRLQSEDVSNKTNIRFGFVYSPMAGPLILLATRGSVPGVSFTSFAEKGTDEGSLKSKWFGLGAAGELLPIKIDRNLIHPYVSTNLKDLLDKKQLDVMLGWSGAIESLPSVYKRFAEVSVALTGLTCVYFTSERKGELKAADLSDLGLNKIPIPMLYPRDHDAGVHRFSRASNNPKETLTYPVDFKPKFPISSTDWTSTVNQVRDLLRDYKGVAFFGWDPYLCWIKGELSGEFGFHQSEPVGLLSAKINDLPIFSRIDIIARTDNQIALNWLSSEREKPDGFFTKLEGVLIQLKNDLLRSDGGPTVDEIADFLCMQPPALALQGLRRSDYGVRYFE